VRIWRPANLPNLYLLALPLIAVTADWGPGVTAVALVAGLGWKWALILRRTARADRRDQRPLVLETIAASHYVEKARWCMDLLGLDYRETATVGVLGVIVTGRSVPRLRIGDGPGASLIGDSADILRYLWAEYGATDPTRAAFLEPSPAAVELERHIDAYGAHIRRWFYFGALPARAFMLRCWGADDERLPRWQRWLIAVAFPGVVAFLRRALGVDQPRTRASVQRVEAFLTEIENLLADERRGLLGDERNYVDYAFAALSGLWLPCPGYGGGAADGYLPPPEDWPATLREDMARWRERFPRVVAFVEGLYATERPRPVPRPTAGVDH
jgi:glutathione S-transferase